MAPDQHLPLADGRARQPDAGGRRIVKVRYHAGSFLPAYRREAGDLNEYTEVTVGRGRPAGHRAADRRHPGAAHRLPGA
jgi:hypothetical protein